MMCNEDIIYRAFKTIEKKFEGIKIIPIKTSDLIFEERVKMNCYYCGKYNNNWRCPPKIPQIDYLKMFSEYDNAAFVMIEVAFSDNNYNDVRNSSSITLHKALLEFEKYLWNNNESMAISFIGGSCKLCKNGCNSERCNNPYMSRTPLEATGVNVVESARRYGINIVFPPKELMVRIGLLLW